MIPLLSQSEKEFLAKGVEDNIRADGRNRLEIRPCNIELKAVPQALGSAHLSLGRTEVLVSVQATIGQPAFQTPGQGSLTFSVDCSAGLCFNGDDDKALSEKNSELSAILHSVFCQSHTLDFSQLCIEAGRFCWNVIVDVLVLDFDGNLIDAISLAVRAALQDTRIPAVSLETDPTSNSTQAIISQIGSTPFDTSKVPVTITLAQLGKTSHYICDPTAAEEACSISSVIVGVGHSGSIHYTLKNGTAPIFADILMDMIQNAQQIASQILNN